MVAGVILGVQYGWSWFGFPGALAGGVAGFIAGVLLGALPLLTVFAAFSLSWRLMSVAKLRHYLHDDNCVFSKLTLLELRRRGEDIDIELPHLCSLLTSDDVAKRTDGWAALTSAFPDLVQTIPGYSPTSTTESCREACGPLRQVAESKPTTVPPSAE